MGVSTSNCCTSKAKKSKKQKTMEYQRNYDMKQRQRLNTQKQDIILDDNNSDDNDVSNDVCNDIKPELYQQSTTESNMDEIPKDTALINENKIIGKFERSIFQNRLLDAMFLIETYMDSVNLLQHTFDNGNNVLHYAIECSSQIKSKFTIFLLQNGADVNVVNELNGNTPLHISVNNEDLRMSAILIKWGANVKIENILGETPKSIGLNKDSDISELFGDNILDHISKLRTQSTHMYTIINDPTYNDYFMKHLKQTSSVNDDDIEPIYIEPVISKLKTLNEHKPLSIDFKNESEVADMIRSKTEDTLDNKRKRTDSLDFDDEILNNSMHKGNASLNGSPNIFHIKTITPQVSQISLQHLCDGNITKKGSNDSTHSNGNNNKNRSNNNPQTSGLLSIADLSLTASSNDSKDNTGSNELFDNDIGCRGRTATVCNGSGVGNVGCNQAPLFMDKMSSDLTPQLSLSRQTTKKVIDYVKKSPLITPYSGWVQKKANHSKLVTIWNKRYLSFRNGYILYNPKKVSDPNGNDNMANVFPMENTEKKKWKKTISLFMVEANGVKLYKEKNEFSIELKKISGVAKRTLYFKCNVGNGKPCHVCHI